jgi:hypothetical protein
MRPGNRASGGGTRFSAFVSECDGYQMVCVPYKRLMSKAELEIEYDQETNPVSAMCTACREMMPRPPADIVNSADIILWFSFKFIEHRRLKHLRDDTSS